MTFFVPAMFGAKRASATFVGVSTGPTYSGANSVATFSTVDLGPASAKKVLLGIHWTGGGTNRTLSSVTVDGDATTIIEQDSHTGGSTSVGAAAVIISTAKDDVDVVCTFSGGLGAGITVALSVRYSTNIGTSEYAKTEVQGLNDTSVSGTIDIPPGGLLWLVATGSTNTDSYGMAFTGATEDYDGSTSFTGRYGGAQSNGLSAETGRSIGLTMTDGAGDVDDSGVELIAVSFAPQ
jgi:hypothetical protein